MDLPRVVSINGAPIKRAIAEGHHDGAKHIRISAGCGIKCSVGPEIPRFQIQPASCAVARPHPDQTADEPRVTENRIESDGLLKTHAASSELIPGSEQKSVQGDGSGVLRAQFQTPTQRARSIEGQHRFPSRGCRRRKHDIRRIQDGRII